MMTMKPAPGTGRAVPVRVLAGTFTLLAVLFAAGGCASAPLLSPEPGAAPARAAAAAAELPPEERRRLDREAALAGVPAHPEAAEPDDMAAVRYWRGGVTQRGQRVVVSIQHRALWLMDGDRVLLRAPVAVGMDEPFFYEGRRYDFVTPRGRRVVRGKEKSPTWVPPDWHYYETAVARDLEVVKLRSGQRVGLSDGSRIEVRRGQVGRVNRQGNFWPFTPGTEIIFDGKIFVPPFGTAQRRIAEVLGTRKLDMGDGYLLHGTNEEDSIGAAVSHGCVRLYNEDVEQLYERVRVGTPVFIY
jgi:hypothetical protein